MGKDARFSYPQRIALDKSGNLIVAGGGSHVLHHITPQGKVSTLAGVGGAAGNADGQGAAARFNRPIGLAIDTASGDIFVGEVGGHLIRKVTKTGLVSTLAGMFTISTCVYMYVQDAFHTYLAHAYTHMHTHTHTHAEARTHEHARTRTHTITQTTQSRTHIRKHAHTRLHAHLHAHIFAYIFTHTYMHTLRLDADRQVQRKGFCRRSR